MKKKSAENIDLEKKRAKVIKALLESDDEKMRLRAAKAFPDEAGEGLFDALLDSSDEKVRLQAAQASMKNKKASEKEIMKNIASPFEEWRAKNPKKKSNARGGFKDQWFSRTGYRPHPAQLKIHRSNKRFIVCVCGRRFGKSLLAAREAEVVLMSPGKRVWVVAPTYNLTDKVFREIYKSLVIDGNIPPEAIVKKSESERIIKLAWGSEVAGKTSDNPVSLLGEAVDLLIFDECAKEKRRVWEQYLRPTLTDRQGRALFITTPEGTNWVYRLHQMSQRGKHRDWESYTFPTENNPHVKREELEEARRTLAPEVFNQEYLVDFFSFAGKVYKDFLRDKHVRGICLA